MIGTNLPVDSLFAPPSRILAAIHDMVADLMPEEQIAILRGNAELIYSAVRGPWRVRH
ncbi:hypothetical protein [Aureimonas psammosilenae]|uniref:hypothetical protein n=1 Tax=Aureimonas psammosilenae TaxID=2495496 RepID=UPI00186AB0F3|nr:hypothetical protein [Aureimonas psammosilenae]